MADKAELLNRGDAPFTDKVWEKIDQIAIEAAKSQLSARRILHTEGPYGLALKSLPGPDREIKQQSTEKLSVMASLTIPVAELRSSFILSARDIAAFEQTSLLFDAGPIAEAAIACARKEDDLIFNGAADICCEGLLNAKGAQSLKLKAWDEIGTAIEDLIAAVTKLDDAGFHGPYTLALPPKRYNLLFRRYPQGNATEIGHIRELITQGIVKTTAMGHGGVLLASGRQFASIVLGQDLVTAFVGPSARDYEFAVTESLALRLIQPAAICTLR